MDLLLIVLMLIVAVLASNLISKLLPRVATPLVQIALGMVLSVVVPVASDFELPSNLFMMLFVAPLVYAESRSIDRLTAWRNRGTILRLAIGLVVIMTLVVGVVMGAAVPMLPFAAAFVLGAALSPTDAVAVPALAEFTSVSPRQHAILSSESIVNDATGVVVFNLALAALVSGSFSPVEAGASFAYLFFGGILAGLVLGVMANFVSAFVRSLGCDDVTFHVLFDLAIPFVVFLAGERVGVSPIMAVMVCALVFNLGVGKAGPDEARMNIVSNSVWNTITFALNGFVFLMLGYELNAAIQALSFAGYSAAAVFGAAVLLVALVCGLRFCYIYVLEAMSRRRIKRLIDAGAKVDEVEELLHGGAEPQSTARSAAVLTFAGGTKGAVTMSIALSIPYSVASRSLIIFLISMVIIASVVAANVLVPLLAPAPKRTKSQTAKAERKACIEILRRVEERLSAEATRKTRKATQLVIADYNMRIRNMRSGLADANDERRRAVRMHALKLECARVSQLMDAGDVEEKTGYRYLSRVEALMEALDHRSHASWLLARNMRRARGMVRTVIGVVSERVQDILGNDEPSQMVTLRRVQLECARYVVAELGREVQEDHYPVEDVTQVLMDYQHVIELLSVQNPSLTTLARRANLKEQIQLKGVGYELEEIQDALDAGAISRETARKMKDGAYLMRLDLEKLV